MREGGFTPQTPQEKRWFKKGEEMGQPPTKLKIDESGMHQKKKMAKTPEEQFFGDPGMNDETKEKPGKKKAA